MLDWIDCHTKAALILIVLYYYLLRLFCILKELYVVQQEFFQDC